MSAPRFFDIQQIQHRQQFTYSQKSMTMDHEYKRSQAWKHRGYGDFSEWMASSNDFFIIRRFGALNARILLFMQYRITCLENDLKHIDVEVENSPNPAARNNSLKHDHGSIREEIIEQLIPLLKEYSKSKGSDSPTVIVPVN